MRASRRVPIVICEYDTLTTSQVESPSPAPNSVSREDFDFLAGLGNAFVARCDAQTLRWKSLVGVVRTPTGTEIEILPKIFDGEAMERSRKLLERMLETALDLHHREAEEADIRSFKASLTEWVARRFRCRLHARRLPALRLQPTMDHWRRRGHPDLSRSRALPRIHTTSVLQIRWRAAAYRDL